MDNVEDNSLLIEEEPKNCNIDTDNNLVDKDDEEVPKIDSTTDSMDNKVDNGENDDPKCNSSNDVQSELNDLYNISEDVDSTANLSNEVSDLNETSDVNDASDVNDVGEGMEDEEVVDRAPKRSGEVITIDSDSDDSSICHVESYQATASEAKRLRKGYTTSESSSSSSEDSEFDEEEEEEDVESDGLDTVVDGPSILSKFVKKPRKKSLEENDFELNDCFSKSELNTDFLSHWSKNESFESENLILHNDPFQICILNNFMKNPEIIDCIVDDMNTMEWTRKIMDLYEFHRTSDLKDLTWQRSIKWIYEFLEYTMMPWVSKVTNTELTHISASAALYGPGDHLLIHDDLLEDRKIAFIFYLAPWDITNDDDSGEDAEKVGWKKSMGGELEFFGSNEAGQPTVPVKRLTPKNNSFAFFKVGNKSFHQVSEVLSYDYPRLTINGWFHGPVEVNDDQKNEEMDYVENVETLPPNNDILQQELNQWITSIYLTPSCRDQIVKKFENTSEISLVNFFIEQKYEDILNVLQRDDLQWERKGPLNLRNYEILPLDKINNSDSHKPLSDITKLLSCKHFVNLLRDYTGNSGLSIQTFCKLEVQKWTAGSYTVLPTKSEYSTSEIDIIIYMGCPDRLIKGGHITYILCEQQNADPIISVGLKNNALNIVYCEAGLAKFTKYVSKLSFKDGEQFFMLVCSFRGELNN